MDRRLCYDIASTDTVKMQIFHFNQYWDEKKKNKRPRGLDVLLGHLLVKIIPVTYQLSSTKIPKYLSQN